MKNPTIYIIGAGAIGKALAVFLQQENKKVILVRGSIDHKAEIQQTIKVTNHKKRSFSQTIRTTTLSNIDPVDGIILVAVKAFANKEIAQKLKKKNGQFPVVLLQNGLNIEEPFHSFKEVYRCVLFSTSQVTSANMISFKTVSDSPIGIIKGNEANLIEIINHIQTAQFSFKFTTDISSIVWSKVILNCAFNSICPLLEVDNGIFHRNSEAFRLAEIVIKECVALAKKYNIEANVNEVLKKLKMISQRADGQLISTFEDIRNGRRTEIESLNLEIARLAEKIGMPELVTRTKLLGEMIQLKSDLTRTNDLS